LLNGWVNGNKEKKLEMGLWGIGTGTLNIMQTGQEEGREILK